MRGRENGKSKMREKKLVKGGQKRVRKRQSQNAEGEEKACKKGK